MQTRLKVAVSTILVTLAASSPGHAGKAENAEAQRLLNVIGYPVGTADGVAGRRTLAAMEAFAASQGQAFDGSIDESDLVLLRSVAPAYEVSLRRPGELFDHTHGRSSQCNGLEPRPDIRSAEDIQAIEPFAAFDDAVAIGYSAKRDIIQPWLEQIVMWSVQADAFGDKQAGALAISELRRWASAKAFTETVIDHTYGGGGDGADYRPDARSPILDMENVVRSIFVVIYALEMLDAQLEDADRALISDWAHGLLARFAPEFPGPGLGLYVEGIFSYDNRPGLILSILDRDDKLYQGYVEAFYDRFRRSVSSDGAIIRNVNRGDRAIMYHALGVNGMASVLSLVEMQGSRIPVDIEAMLHAAVAFLIRADMDDAVVAGYAADAYHNPGDGQHQDRGYLEDQSFQWWTTWYLSRFPDHENAKLVRAYIDRRAGKAGLTAYPLASITYPYPVNCYVAYDMSKQAVAEANAHVDATYGADAWPVFSWSPLGDVTPPTLEVRRVDISLEERLEERIQYQVSLLGVKVDGKRMSPISFQAQTSFDDPSKPVASATNIIFGFLNYTLDGESSQKDYTVCGSMGGSVIEEGDQWIQLYMRADNADVNRCVLDIMSEKDRQFWSAVLGNFEAILAKADESEDVADLRRINELIKLR